MFLLGCKDMSKIKKNKDIYYEYCDMFYIIKNNVIIKKGKIKKVSFRLIFYK